MCDKIRNNRRRILHIAGCFFSAMLLLHTGAMSSPIYRLPIAAGGLYPADAETLLATLNRLFATVDYPEPEARQLASIVPYSGYGLSGDVAAQAFKHLKPGQYDRVILLAPATFSRFEGCSIPSIQAFATPLGFIPLDDPIIRRLCYCPLITTHSLRYEGARTRDQLHEREYAIEVVLPFLQERLRHFRIVPILVGLLRDSRGGYNAGIIEAVAEALRGVMDERTLIVVCAHFTHYGAEFDFEPFPGDPAAGIEDTDQQLIRLVLERNAAGFEKYLERHKVPISGRDALHILLRLLPRSAQGMLLKHEISGKRIQSFSHSVSFAAISFYDTTKPPVRPRPIDPMATFPFTFDPAALGSVPGIETAGPDLALPVEETGPPAQPDSVASEMKQETTRDE